MKAAFLESIALQGAFMVNNYIRLTAVLLVLALCSCGLMIPWFRSPASPKEETIKAAGIKPGTTTKEDFFLQFGCGFKRSDDEKIFVTEISRSGSLGVAAMGFGVDTEPYSNRSHFWTTPETYLIEIEFDDREIVNRYETFKMPEKISVEKLTSHSK
jgi:hypothetical protein